MTTLTSLPWRSLLGAVAVALLPLALLTQGYLVAALLPVRWWRRRG